MTPQAFMQFLSTRRTYRPSTQDPVPACAVDDLLEAARIASCSANRQTLRYLVVQSPRMVRPRPLGGLSPARAGRPRSKRAPHPLCRRLPGHLAARLLRPGPGPRPRQHDGSRLGARRRQLHPGCHRPPRPRAALRRARFSSALQPGGLRPPRAPQPRGPHAERRRPLLSGREPRLLRSQTPAGPDPRRPPVTPDTQQRGRRALSLPGSGALSALVSYYALCGTSTRRINQLSSQCTVTVPPYFSAVARTLRIPYPWGGMPSASSGTGSSQ